MRFSRMITTVGTHAEGAYAEVVIGGVMNVPGESMFDKAQYLEHKHDDLRQFLLYEPRGKVAKSVNIVFPSFIPKVDAGFIIMESESYPPMSGTNAISTVAALLETGTIKMEEPYTHLTLEAPGGVIKVKAECRDDRCVQVTFENVPCFVFGLDLAVNVPGLGTIRVDVAYGGMIYVIVDLDHVGLPLEPSRARELSEVGERIKIAAAEQILAVHPENPLIHTINQTLLAGPLKRDDQGRLTARNTVVVSPGRLDRSPCGTGTCARLAVMHARGQIGVEEPFIHESIVGTKFVGEIRQLVSVGGRPAIVPTIGGRAWVTGFHQYVLDPTDPLPTGFRLSDTWPMPNRS